MSPRKASPPLPPASAGGLCPENADALSLAGEVQFARSVPGFVPPHAKSVDFLSHTPRLLRPAVSHAMDVLERLIFLEQDEIEKNKGIRIEKFLGLLKE